VSEERWTAHLLVFVTGTELDSRPSVAREGKVKKHNRKKKKTREPSYCGRKRSLLITLCTNSTVVQNISGQDSSSVHILTVFDMPKNCWLQIPYATTTHITDVICVRRSRHIHFVYTFKKNHLMPEVH
jgi:hypothetical protein